MLLTFVNRLLVFSILGASVYLAFQWMIGDFYGERIALSIEQWSSQNNTPSETVLVKHLEFSEESLKWSPENPRYKELRARLLTMQISNLANTSDVLTSLDEIVSLHIEASIERPQWPFSWANIAYLKSLRKQFDDEYLEAVQNVVAYGPYEVGALQRIVQSGARAWDWLGLEEEDAINQAIANGVLIDYRFARNVKKILKQKGLLEEACEQVPFYSESSKKRLCG